MKSRREISDAEIDAQHAYETHLRQEADFFRLQLADDIGIKSTANNFRLKELSILRPDLVETVIGMRRLAAIQIRDRQK